MTSATLAQIDAALAEIKRVREQKRAMSFEGFLPHWKFINRETGAVQSFADPWPGQRRLVETMQEHSWLLALKAGKLGFTELECAYDAWVLLTRGPNTRVHLFSKNGDAARDLLQYVRFGLKHLPDHLRPLILAEKAGGDTVKSLRVQPPPWLQLGKDDIRTIMSYSTDKHVSVESSCQHAHVDELWAMMFPRESWAAIASTVAPAPVGTCHIITRGGGEGNYVTTLWETATGNFTSSPDEVGGALYPFFEPWDGRPDRDQRWYEAQSANFVPEEMARFAPITAEDALYSTGVQSFVPMALWEACAEHLPPYLPQNRESTVLGVDAGFKSDCFGIVAVTRHPNRPGDPAIRAVKLWTPPPGGVLDVSGPESFIRLLCLGGCIQGHPLNATKTAPDERFSPRGESGDYECSSCRDPELRVLPYNITQIAFDPSQMLDMSQRLSREIRTTWWEEFNQGAPRLKADRQLYDLILQRRLAWPIETEEPGKSAMASLREHVQNASARVQLREDSTMRIEKKSEGKKIDLVVAASMAVSQCLYLVLASSRPA